MAIEIPLAVPDLSGREEEYVLDALRSTWISSTGKYIERFERKFADICNTKSCISVSNGTIALHLALLTLKAGPGDEVIVPSLTYIATANAVRYVGAEPVFVDIDPANWCIAPDLIEKAISPRTKGIIAVHLYGHPADMDAINTIAAKHGLWVVEDAAEAPLAKYKNKVTGGMSSIGIFSFYGNKVFTSGEGGALTLSAPELESRARLLRGQGMDPEKRYFFPVTGYNFRLTNIACAFLCAQLERSDEMIQNRNRIIELYKEKLDGVKGLQFQPVEEWAKISPWFFNLLIDKNKYGRTRDNLINELGNRGIETRPFFIPLHQLPPFREKSMARKEHLPHTDRIACEGLNLPTYSGMSNDKVQKVADTIIGLRR